MRKNLGKHQILETFWKATWTQHESNMRKHQVLETFWKVAWAQHGINIHKNLGKHQVLEMVWKALWSLYEFNMHKVQENTRFLNRLGKKDGHTMKATCAITRKNLGNIRFLKYFWAVVWTHCLYNMLNHMQKPEKTPGS